MAGILVNKGELKNIRDSVDKLLKLGEENVISHAQYASYESEDLTEREKKILKYVGDNPGTTKEGVIKNLSIGSRMTIAKSIDSLTKLRMLIVKRDDSNKHIQHLYINNDHVVLSLSNDLEFFKQVYFRLIDETNKILKKLDRSKDKESHKNIYELLEPLLMPYKYLIIMYITSDIFLWRERPVDKQTLHNKFAIVYGSMQEIHTKLYEITPIITHPLDTDFNLEPLSSALYSARHGLSPEHIIYFLSDFEQYGLSLFAEPVLDALWKISYPVLPNVDLWYASENTEVLKDWRKIISRYERVNYKPKTTQAQNLGKTII